MVAHAHFEGRVVTEWLRDGRTMRMLEPFRFVDQLGVFWDCPVGAIVDGASIPQFLWSTTGGPYTGKYRMASVPHDVYCVTRSRSWEDTHKMFYEAMLAAGVKEAKASLLYAAVYHHGPRWDENGKDIESDLDEEW
jgi:hypothetical protein